jgi:hypothetical protein
MKRGLWWLLVVALGLPAAARAKDCFVEECAGAYDPQCYIGEGYKWCQRTSGNGLTWTPINVYNHTRYSQVASAWSTWNYPPAPLAQNSVYMTTDGVNNSSHDIDYWESNTSEWWWGMWHVGSAPGGCISRGAGAIYLNVFRIGANAADGATQTRALKTALHETGHGIGLGHVCSCPMIMQPCLSCSAGLSDCDASGAQSLYPQ